MTHEWYIDIKNVFELAEFMVESDQVVTAKELLEYFRHPEKYTEVWNLYQAEIHGRTPGSHRPNLDTKTPFPVMIALADKKAY